MNYGTSENRDVPRKLGHRYAINLNKIAKKKRKLTIFKTRQK